MRENSGSSKLDRWGSYDRGGKCLERWAPEDNSPEQVFLECGLVIAVPLAIAALIELAMRMPATYLTAVIRMAHNRIVEFSADFRAPDPQPTFLSPLGHPRISPSQIISQLSLRNSGL